MGLPTYLNCAASPRRAITLLLPSGRKVAHRFVRAKLNSHQRDKDFHQRANSLLGLPREQRVEEPSEFHLPHISAKWRRTSDSEACEIVVEEISD